MADNATAGQDNKITLTQDEVNALKERTRDEERQKLRSKLEKLDDTQAAYVKALESGTTAKEELQALKAELAKQTEAMDALKKSVKAEGNVDVAQLIREVSDKADNRFKQEFNQKISSLEADQASLRAENARLRVETYKQRRLGEESSKGTKMIRELVTGGTEAEIEASLQDAIAKHQHYFGAQPAAGAAGSVQPMTQGAGQQGARPVVAQAEGSQQETMRPSPIPADAGVAQMVSDVATGGKQGKKLFKENRDALLAAAAAEAESRAGNNAIVR